VQPESGLSGDIAPSPQPLHRDAPPARAVRPPAFSAAPPPPIAIHQAPVSQTSVAVAPPKPDSAARQADQPAPIVITPASDTPTTGGATPQGTGETPRFHVQVGIFKAEEDAQALVQRLHSLGYIATSDQGDGYRVWVGGYFDRETAERLATNLRKAGFDAVLVP